MGRIYERLDIRLTEVAAERMRRLTLARSRYEKGRRDSPPLADLGLLGTAGMVGIDQFDDYCSRFGIFVSEN